MDDVWNCDDEPKISFFLVGVCSDIEFTSMGIGIVISSEQKEIWVCLRSNSECTPSDVLNNPMVSWFRIFMCSHIEVLAEFPCIVI